MEREIQRQIVRNLSELCTGRRNQSKGGYLISGLKIITNYGNWIGSASILAYDDAGNEKWATNTAKDETVRTWAALVNGETCTSSSYGGVTTYPDMINDGLPTLSTPSTYGAVQWSDGAGAGQEFYGKWSSSFVLKDIYLALNTTGYGDNSQTWTFFDQDDNALTPIIKPANQTDYYQTTTSATWNWYHFGF